MFNFFKSASPAGLSLQDAVSLAAAGGLTLIDVRELAELKGSGKAKGALHIPLSLVPLKADPKSAECPKGMSCDGPIAVYCASGGRSGMAAGALRKMGYTNVHNIGGFGDWVAAGGPSEKV